MSEAVQKGGDLSLLWRLLRAANLRPAFFAVPLVTAIFASLFEGLSLALLVPAIESIVSGKTPHVAVLSDLLPADASRYTHLLVLVVGVFTAAVLQIVCSYISSVATSAQVYRMIAELRKLTYNRFLGFGKLFFDRRNVGQLQQTLLGFVSQVGYGLSNIHGFLSAIFLLGVYMAIMFYISWRLTFLVLTVFPVLHYSLHWLIKKIAQTSYAYSASSNELSKKISNSLTMMPLVKAYSQESFERERFAQICDEVRSFEYSIAKKGQLIGPIQQLILLAFLLMLVCIVAYLLADGDQRNVGQFAVYLLILKRSATQFGVFNSFRTAVASISGALHEVGRVFDEQDKAYSVYDGPKEFPGLREALELKSLSFYYPGGVQALSDVSLTLRRGEMTAIVGESGSGKSTIINLLMRFYDAPKSTIFADGDDIREFSINSWRKQFALVSQDTLLFHESIRYNLLYGLAREISAQELEDVLEKARLSELIANLPKGLDTVIGDRGIMLSGGERQRVSIARAMLKKASVLLLDEATSSLDSRTETLIQQALDQLIQGKTTLVVAHRLSTIKHADRILVLEKGRIVEQGSLEALLRSRGQFFRYWEEQRIQL